MPISFNHSQNCFERHSWIDFMVFKQRLHKKTPGLIFDKLHLITLRFSSTSQIRFWQPISDLFCFRFCLYHSSNVLDDTNQECHLELSSKSTVEKLKPPFLVFISLSKGHAVPILFSSKSDLARFLFKQL